MPEVFIIAEAGVNHNGSIKHALSLVDAAAAAGANCVKFQTFRADLLAARQAKQAAYQRRNIGHEEDQLTMLRALELSPQDHTSIKSACDARGIEFLSTAFDPESLRFLVDQIGIKRIKIPSGEITNPLLLAAASQFEMPIILSTGMSTLQDVADALGMLAFSAMERPKSGLTRQDLCDAAQSREGRNWLSRFVTILHCTSDYPVQPEDVNLLAMTRLASSFDLPVGYSDHTLGSAAAVGAVALGAVVVEKHLTFDKNAAGPDHKASMAPDEFTEFVKMIRDIERMGGDGVKRRTSGEEETLMHVRRGLYAARSIGKDELLTPDSIVLLRPATQIDARDYWSIVGTRSHRDYQAGDEIEASISPE